MAGFACLMSLRSEPGPPWKTKETGLASLEDTFPKRGATGAHLDETRSRGVAELRPSCGRAAADVRVVSHLVGDEGLGIAQDLGVELDVA